MVSHLSFGLSQVLDVFHTMNDGYREQDHSLLQASSAARTKEVYAQAKEDPHHKWVQNTVELGKAK
jgi:hypothetical protein